MQLVVHLFMEQVHHPTPYSIPWANSLFEDNAEFGMGIKIADEVKKNQLKQIISENLSKVEEEEKRNLSSLFR